MKAVLMSLKPKYVELIASGSKTIEVRKTRPKIETPFKCYIYCTQLKNGKNSFLIAKDGKKVVFGDYRNAFTCDIDGNVDWHIGNGKVIGHFTCDRIDSYIDKHLDDNRYYWDLSVKEWEDLTKKSCLTIPQIIDYTGDSNNCYGWHITDLTVYDKPRELSEFRKYYECGNNSCGSCDKCDKDYHLTRPFQSWGYILGE